MRRRILACVMGLVSAILLTPGRAHEGHDHGAPPPPVSNTVAPRGDASSSDFEVVAVARGGRLVVYLDTFRENAPVENARIEIDTPRGVLTPQPAGEGT